MVILLYKAAAQLPASTTVHINLKCLYGQIFHRSPIKVKDFTHGVPAGFVLGDMIGGMGIS